MTSQGVFIPPTCLVRWGGVWVRASAEPPPPRQPKQNFKNAQESLDRLAAALGISAFDAAALGFVADVDFGGHF